MRISIFLLSTEPMITNSFNAFRFCSSELPLCGSFAKWVHYFNQSSFLHFILLSNAFFFLFLFVCFHFSFYLTLRIPSRPLNFHCFVYIRELALVQRSQIISVIVEMSTGFDLPCHAAQPLFCASLSLTFFSTKYNLLFTMSLNSNFIHLFHYSCLFNSKCAKKILRTNNG